MRARLPRLCVIKAKSSMAAREPKSSSSSHVWPVVDSGSWLQVLLIAQGFFEEVAGGWQGEALDRPDQGEIESRDPLD